MVVISIVGTMGKAKTATMTYMALVRYLKGVDLYSNYNLWLNIKKSFRKDGLEINQNIQRLIVKKINNYEDFTRIHNGVLLGDELWSMMDSREYAKSGNKIISDLLLKSRKRGFDIINTVQHFSQLEKRLRNVTNYVIYPEIKIIFNGQTYIVNQNVLEPIDMKPFLNYSTVFCTVCELNERTQEYTTPVQEFQFPLKTVVHCYDTTEEIKVAEIKEVK